MIVKDEADVILRCLESVKNIIDYWVISDTGSTDGTQQIIKDFFEKHRIEGELTEDPWQDFAHNRNIALENAKGKMNYILMMDADDYLVADNNFKFENLSADSYMLKMLRGSIDYFFTKLIRSDLPWIWKSVLHEYLECTHSHTTEKYSGHCFINSTTEGARSQNPDKYKNDIEVLEKALKNEPNNTRYQFYLAQSYRDDRNFERACKEYQKRVEMGGWPEEVYYSLYEIGNTQKQLGMKQALVIDSLLKAYFFRPSRLEALHEAVSLCRRSKQYHLGYHLGISAIDTPLTSDVLFVSSSIYTWELKDEIAVCASWINRKAEAKKINNELLKIENLPENERERIRENLTYC